MMATPLLQGGLVRRCWGGQWAQVCGVMEVDDTAGQGSRGCKCRAGGWGLVFPHSSPFPPNPSPCSS